MPTQEIPRHEWHSFFKGFSGQHEDWLVSVEVIGSNQDAQVRARNMPLREITAN